MDRNEHKGDGWWLVTEDLSFKFIQPYGFNQVEIHSSADNTSIRVGLAELDPLIDALIEFRNEHLPPRTANEPCQHEERDLSWDGDKFICQNCGWSFRPEQPKEAFVYPGGGLPSMEELQDPQAYGEPNTEIDRDGKDFDELYPPEDEGFPF